MPRFLLTLLPITCLLLNTSVQAQTNKLEPTGNVGVGTLTPSEKLTVYNGNLLFRKQFGTGPDYDWFTIGSYEQVEKPVTGVHIGLLGSNINPITDADGKPTSRNNQPTAAYSQAWALTFGSGDYYNNFSIWGGRHATANMPLVPMFNITSLGNVGIGTTTPQQKLDVGGYILSAPSSVEGGLYLGNANHGVRRLALTNTVELFTTEGSIILSASGIDGKQLSIGANGDVEMGTPSKTSRLIVNGPVTATKVRVRQDVWADFVFEPGYVLPPLNDLERFIKINKHLPQIPTAGQIAENGLDVGENQAKLLQKIEELTLYIIEQHKALDAMKKQLSEQGERLHKLESNRRVTL